MFHMKKLILAVVVVVSFILYSLFNRNENNASTVTTSQVNTPAATGPAASPSSSTSYKDGSYTGNAADAIYGYIQVKATVSGGKLTNVEFLQYPNDRRTSIEINSQAMPLLKQEAIKAQSSQVDGVSGATDTSQAFIQSIGDALSQAKA
jgi:uncharacterized protein with FMN-binding domain